MLYPEGRSDDSPERDSSRPVVAPTNAVAIDQEPAVAPSGPEPVAEPSEDSGSTLPKTTRSVRSNAPVQAATALRPDPLVQTLMLLLTMAAMLTAARFAVPRIVEEIRYAWHRGELRAEYESGTEGLRNISLETLSDAYQMVTAAVGPSVVHIDVERRLDDQQANLAQQISSSIIPSSDQGSGVIVDELGYVITNRHVISDGDQISVTLSDGRRVPAEVLGTDSLTDLAVLKIDSDRLIPIVWGDSDRCRVGSPVWAVGSPFGLDRTVTFGILSGKHRVVRASNRYGAHGRYQDFMQSDVAVNPGNSGGPLVDAGGRLVGINTAIVGDTYQGVSFSIPSNVAKQVYERLRDHGHVERGWLGVQLAEVPDELLRGDDARTRGALITGLANKQSPAAAAGLLGGDLVLTLDDLPVVDMGHLMRMIGSRLGGSTVRLGVIRHEESMDFDVKLGSRPLELDLR